MEVVISTNDIESEDAKRLAKQFPKYDVKIIYARSHSVLVNLQSIVASHSADKYCLFIRDDSLSQFNAEDIYDVIEDALCHKWDLFYLCKWLDFCEQYTKYIKLNQKFLAVRTYHPQGIQALIISPKIFDKITALKSEAELMGLIKGDKIRALTSIPNIFEFDIGKRASDADIIKRFPCQSVFSGAPNIRSYVQNGGDPSVQLQSYKVDMEKGGYFKPSPPTKSTSQTTTVPANPNAGWMDSISYDDLTKVLLLAMIIGVIVSCFRKPSS